MGYRGSMALSGGWESTRGEKHRMAKLTEAQALAIQNAPNAALEALAKKYGISFEYAKLVHRGRRWGYLKKR